MEPFPLDLQGRPSSSTVASACAWLLAVSAEARSSCDHAQSAGSAGLGCELWRSQDEHLKKERTVPLTNMMKPGNGRC